MWASQDQGLQNLYHAECALFWPIFEKALFFQCYRRVGTLFKFFPFQQEININTAIDSKVRTAQLYYLLLHYSLREFCADKLHSKDIRSVGYGHIRHIQREQRDIVLCSRIHHGTAVIHQRNRYGLLFSRKREIDRIMKWIRIS